MRLLIGVVIICGGAMAFHHQLDDDLVGAFEELERDIYSQNNLERAADHDHRRKSPSSFHPTTIHHVIRNMKCKLKGKLICTADCEHHKLLFVDGCCQCVCMKNYALVSSTRCHRASWSKWSRWSKCIKSKWGGLQTRERICKSYGKEAPGACAGRGSSSRTCSSITEEFRIRKSVLQLTDEEMHDLIQAMTKFKHDTSKEGYRNIVSWHGFPGRCPWITEHADDHHCSWHHHPLFLPWHRMIMVQLELGLQRHLKNKTLGIPYWDWTAHALDIPYLVRHPEIYDPVLKKYVYNPFHRTLISKHKNLYTHRNIWYPGVLMDNFLLKGATRALLTHDYAVFDGQLANNPHDQIHNCMCYKPPRKNDPKNWCDFGMPTVTYAAWDPLFLLHHSAMDRLFVMRRHLEENANVADWTSSRIVGQFNQEIGPKTETIRHAFEWPLSPFCNKSMNPEPVTRKDNVWTLHRSYYNEQLFGYKYADYNLGDYSWESLNEDFKYNNVERKFWNDGLLETKIGNLSVNLCPNEKFDKGIQCFLSCG